VHEKLRYVKLENEHETAGLPSRCSAAYPQVAQTAVEMLIIQRPQIAIFSRFGTLASGLASP
jgi:hypothetical protein